MDDHCRSSLRARQLAQPRPPGDDAQQRALYIVTAEGAIIRQQHFLRDVQGKPASDDVRSGILPHDGDVTPTRSNVILVNKQTVSQTREGQGGDKTGTCSLGSYGCFNA